MRTITLLAVLILGIQWSTAQTDKAAIPATLMDYIEGTSKGQPERIKRAFHSDLNLYSIDAEQQLRALPGTQYIGYFKEGETNDRDGKIVSIDVVNDAAMAKVEIDVPSRKRLYTDYMMLLKIQGEWKIVHKSFTSEAY